MKARLEGTFTTVLDVFDALLAAEPGAEAFVDGEDRITFVEWATSADVTAPLGKPVPAHVLLDRLATLLSAGDAVR